ncbi:MAG: prepilin-type N-terminal cleavage/methylation domain-containing protein [Candidatus Gracilibacteria bacterium]|jgi:prepilin-type N-terminal cleavage/methylation domain-containing protein
MRTLPSNFSRKAFTLIEVLIVVVILAILASIVIFAVNPARQIAQANNAQRDNDVKAILDAVYQYTVDNRGDYPVVILTDPTVIGSDSGSIDLCPALVPDYLTAMPFDPDQEDGGYVDCADYNTGYTIFLNGARLTVSAPLAELSDVISVTR